MRLKKITLFGFKSFADKTTLEFNYGITGIVGPNGCGKSNISDAFRWVLGEQSAKSMRGQKMPDVIFAGTSTRKPLNISEVTITLTDINEGELPIAYNEVAVTRRLHRNGESDYLINRQPVRLKDIHDLFLDSGFSIFEQGKMDQVINDTPLGRRSIFEEAAGILRFLQRKREAMRKLELSQQNIARIKDIHLEVEKQIVVLEVQAEKARLYKENKSHIEKLEKAVFVTKWDALYRKCNDSFEKEAVFKQRLQSFQEKHHATLSELEKTKQELSESERQLKKCNEDVYRAKSEKEIKIREKLSQQERVKEILAKEKRWQQDVESIIEKRDMLKLEQKTVHLHHQEAQQDGLLLEQDALAYKKKVQELEADLIKLREDQQKAQQELLLLLQSESQIESELKQNTVRLEHHRERKEQLAERREKLAELLKELTRQVSEKDELVKDASSSIDRQKELHHHMESQIDLAIQEIHALQKDLESVQIDWTESKAREKALLRLREEMEGFSSGTKRLLLEASNARSPLHQKIKGLYEYIAPEEGTEVPVSSALKAYAQTLVVESCKDYEEVVAYASSNQLKDFSLFCLEFADRPLSPTNQRPGSVEPLLSKNANPVARHFLTDAVKAETKETALDWIKNAPHGSAWLKEGIFIDHHQVVFHVAQGENTIFLRESELKTLEKKIQELEVQKHALDQSLKTLQEKRIQLQEEKKELDQSIRRSEMKFMEMNFSLQRTRTDQEKAQQEIVQIDQEEQSLQSAIENLMERLAQLNKHHSDARAKAAQEKELNAVLAEDLEKRAQKMKEEQLVLQQKEALSRKQSEECNKFSHALHVLEVKILDSQEQEKRLREELELSRDSIELLRSQESDFEFGLEEVEEKLENALTAQADKERETLEWKAKIESFDQVLDQERGALKKEENELHQILIQLAQIESSRKALEEEVNARYQSSIQDLKEQGYLLDQAVDKAEKQLKSLRHAMEAAGDINMTSIEEYEKGKVRYDFLKQQIEDLSGSKEELEAMISQLDSESRKLFKETFEKIRVNFQKNFKILFNGGEADLQFTDEQNVLEAGIDIVAMPPGKQMRSIHLMSGGEKCMTAMALLFAIFEVKPAPFCILDEIDAPLDDSNVERFANVLKQFIDRCQFIIITHNKTTMSIADVLFGVSMEEKGVSKLLSLNFASAESLVEIN